MNEVTFKEFNENPFKMIGEDWLLFTAKKDDKVNTMTASWGGVGIMWGKKVAYIFVRPQRYTKEFIDNSERLTISVLPNSFRKDLSYLGSVSGKDEDKISKSNLTVKEYENTPYFDEARLVLVCKKLYMQKLEENCFIEKDLADKWYPNKDYHFMYVVEIEKILEK
ncbi:flavin reductase [uncultured Clostridium sp.]|uniref:flavin reductase n=1 Tax=uncultured Clostridium sp. TaxID=59620 RepID=UPI002603C0DE|nr:flavin reductase [uncultured Clostridium sp.]